MKLVVSKTWLRDKILTDPDIDGEAGAPAAFSLLEQFGMFISEAAVAAKREPSNIELKVAFGTLLRQLRRRDGLTYDDLAQKASVDAEELLNIEHDVSYQPRPRTIHNIAKLFDLPPRELMKLAGAARTMDTLFQTKALKFAAKSDDLSKLTDDERQALNEYIKYLNDPECAE